MKLKIEIEMDNAAFGESKYEAGEEASRILGAQVIDRLEEGGKGFEVGTTYNLRDINGNHVGTFVVEA